MPPPITPKVNPFVPKIVYNGKNLTTINVISIVKTFPLSKKNSIECCLKIINTQGHPRHKMKKEFRI
jgi:hypothetical protein